MKRLFCLFLLWMPVVPLLAKGPARPKLVVGIVVDQMRWDFLYRFYDAYGPGGFRRMMGDGFRCEQAVIDYLPSFTAPGHAAIYTGSVPAIHGIAGNEWWENGRNIYCTQDDTARPVGGSQRWGKMSPRNLWTTTVTDELRLATNFRSRVYAVSLKDRSSILPGGHLANEVYWFDDSTGNFSSSSYYMQQLPGWVRRFNGRHYADTILARDWELLDDSTTYTQSSVPNPRYEGLYDVNEKRIGFSHRAGFFTGTGSTRYNAVRKLPAGNWLSLLFARECIAANGLGTGPDPDVLCISLSSTDYIGHQFGPNSREIEDTYRRLDRELADFLRYLDKTVGAGAYTVFLTADHGGAHNALFLSDMKIPAGNISIAKWRDALNRRLQPISGLRSTVASLDNYQVFLSDSVRDAPAMLRIVRNMLLERPEVQDVYDAQDAGSLLSAPEALRGRIVNGYVRTRSSPVLIILRPGYYSGYASTGTTHGTWNPYDTHIPLLWYGWGVRRGELQREVHITDIAATLAALLKVQMPNGCIGHPVPELLKASVKP